MYKIRSYDTLIRYNFDRIKSGKYFDDNYQPYTKEFLERMIEYFVEREEYESCDFLKKHIEIRFSHDKGFNSHLK